MTWKWKSHFSYALLMGGQGKRLGTIDKAALRWRGQSLAYIATRCGFELADQVLWIGASQPPSFYDLYTDEHFDLDRLDLYPDSQHGTGCLAGILSALQHARSEWVWIIACDLPLISPPFLKGLLKDWTDCDHPPSLSSSNLTIQKHLSNYKMTNVSWPRLIAYQTTSHFHPLCALWHTSLYDSVFKLLQKNQSLQTLKDAPFTQTLPLQNSLPLLNLNTPEDIKHLSALAISSDLSILTENLKSNGGNQP